MFKILGQEALYVEISDVFKKRMLELANDKGDEKVFRTITERSEVTYLLNGTTEEHTFFIHVPKDVTPEDIQKMADASLSILGRTVESTPCVEVAGVRQKYQVIITNWDEPEIIGLNKTPGMSSGAVFKPIIDSLSGRGRENMNYNRDQFF